MVVETLYVTINRDELKELREESAELARLRAQLAAQPQAEPVADRQGGEGREVAEVVAWRLERYVCTLACGVDSYSSPQFDSERPLSTDRNVEPLMTVAQHSRIVAAKDAEIARLWADRKTDAALIHELRAQPARQVGADAYDFSVFAGYLLDNCEGETISEEMLQHRMSDMLADPHYGALFRREKQPHPSVLEVVQGSRAALAPAAACVMPPYADLDDHPVADIEYQRDVGWNMALAKVARLNRNPIPVELLERIADNLESTSRHRPCTSQAHCLLTELRALLNKDEK